MQFKLPLSLLQKMLLFVAILFPIFSTFYLFSLSKKIELSTKEITGYRQFFENYKRVEEQPQQPTFYHKSLPDKLINVPLAEAENIVLATKKVIIRDILAPYNPSVLKHANGYLMFFRYDTLSRGIPSSHIGCVELNKQFEQTEKEFVKLDTSAHNPENPRVFQIGINTYLTYTKKEINPTFVPATMTVAAIDLTNYTLKFTTELELNLHSSEKNWIPFEYINHKGKPELFFQYSLNPHKILALPNPRVNQLTHPIFSRQVIFQPMQWEQPAGGWGPMQGGSPALKLDNEYLAFFHSSFQDKGGAVWSTMGAYTFEGKPPFRMTSLSPYPVLFSGIYNSLTLNTSDLEKYSIFPGSFVMEKEKGKDLIYLACGENDSAIKIVTIDKKALLKRLKKI